MMSTRASSKRKRINRTTIKNKKFKTSRSSTDKRPRSTNKPQLTIRSSFSIHDNNLDTHDNSSLEKSLLVIDCLAQSEHGGPSSPEAAVYCNSKKLSIKKGPLHSSTIIEHSITTQDELNTEDAYRKLQDVISMCSPIGERILSTTDRNKSSYTNNAGSVVLDTEDQVILQPPSSQITPITTRINPSHNSLIGSGRVNRSEPRIDQYSSPSTSARNLVNHIPLSSNSTTPSNYTRGSSSGTQYLGGNGLSNINRNTYGIEKNNIRSPNNIPLTSTDDRVTSKSTVSISSTNLALLESIPEYRNLKKELDRERQRCITWSDDYQKLRSEFENYRTSSFPRPSVDGLNFLLQLVENLTVSNTSLDSRTSRDLAHAVGLTEKQLMECCNPNPQRVALLVFSKLHPTHRDRVKLLDIKHFTKHNPKLLDDIYIFARQCNPSTIYSVEKMREAIAASIRQSKHQIIKVNKIELKLSKIGNHHINDENDVEQITDNTSLMMNVHTQYLNNNEAHECLIDETDYRMDQ